MATMQPPPSGVKVRMYRQGHGDCFLLATLKSDATPFYMLIDCGLWRASEITKDRTIDKIIADIATATNSHLDVLLVTHEHQDHVSGFNAKDPKTKQFCFEPFQVDQLWLAWTEDGDDEFANQLRARFNDELVALMGADERLDDAGYSISGKERGLLRAMLEFETGENAADELRANLKKSARTSPGLSLRERTKEVIKGITNKRAIARMRDKIAGSPLFLRPDRGPYAFEGVAGVRVFALGPPRDVELLLSLNPKGAEEFRLGFTLDGPARSFLAATAPAGTDVPDRTFDPRFGIARDAILKKRPDRRALREFIRNAYRETSDTEPDTRWVRQFFVDHYGGARGTKGADGDGWRRIDEDWLSGAESLALRLNNEVNNTSLVIAIELPQTGKVLLFTGDAQRGNWISWAKLAWKHDGRSISARDLLGRTVFLKAGHHGSHNATLSGSADDDYANLGWLAQGAFKTEFVAMIPAHTKWAKKAQHWEHPLKKIEEELHRKARGRVFRTDVDRLTRPDSVPQAEWGAFMKRVDETKLFVEYTVLDD
jgi:hypothetical protein